LVNVGSVGLPRDNNPKAAYVIFDADAGAVELRRLDFDQSLTRQKNLAAGL
jgi:predicted phosphodiesterase